MIIASWSDLGATEICALWLLISPLFFPSLSCFPVKPASKTEVTLAAGRIS